MLKYIYIGTFSSFELLIFEYKNIAKYSSGWVSYFKVVLLLLLRSSTFQKALNKISLIVDHHYFSPDAQHISKDL